jgi:hypothetical protein
MRQNRAISARTAYSTLRAAIRHIGFAAHVVGRVPNVGIGRSLRSMRHQLPRSGAVVYGRLARRRACGAAGSGGLPTSDSTPAAPPCPCRTPSHGGRLCWWRVHLRATTYPLSLVVLPLLTFNLAPPALLIMPAAGDAPGRIISAGSSIRDPAVVRAQLPQRVSSVGRSAENTAIRSRCSEATPAPCSGTPARPSGCPSSHPAARFYYLNWHSSCHLAGAAHRAR